MGSYFDEEREDQGFSCIICLDLSDDNYGKVLLCSDKHSEQTGEYAFGTVSDVYLPILESALNSENADENGGIVFSEVELETEHDGFEHLAAANMRSGSNMTGRGLPMTLRKAFGE